MSLISFLFHLSLCFRIRSSSTSESRCQRLQDYVPALPDPAETLDPLVMSSSQSATMVHDMVSTPDKPSKGVEHYSAVTPESGGEDCSKNGDGKSLHTGDASRARGSNLGRSPHQETDTATRSKNDGSPEKNLLTKLPSKGTFVCFYQFILIGLNQEHYDMIIGKLCDGSLITSK